MTKRKKNKCVELQREKGKGGRQGAFTNRDINDFYFLKFLLLSSLYSQLY